jgi:signal transduction histidine kinase
MLSFENEIESGEEPYSRVQHFRSRLWIGTILILASNGVFAIADLWISPDELLFLWAYKGVQVGEVLLIRRRLKASPGMIEMQILGIVMLATSILMAGLSGLASEDPVSTPILAVALLMAAASLLPWRWPAQFALAVFAVVVVGVQAALLSGGAPYGAVGVFSAATCSVLLTILLDRRRIVMANSEKIARESEEREREVSDALLRSGQEIIDGLDREDLLLRFCEIVGDHIDCDSVVAIDLRLADSGSENLFVPVAQFGLSEKQWRRFEGVPLDRSMVPSINIDFNAAIAQTDFPDARPGKEGAHGLSLLIIRLGAAGKLTGLMTVWRGPERKPFAEREHRIASGLAPLMSGAYEQRRLLRQVERAQQWQQSFLASLNHELRTPLNIILGYMEMLMDEERESSLDDRRDLFRRIQENARDQLRLVNEALELSRPVEDGGLSVRLETVDISRLTEDLVRETRMRIVGDDVVVDGAVDGLLQMKTDLVKLRMCLANLLDNSRKFTKAGQIEIRVFREGQEVLFVVSDTGSGIPAELQPALFDAFQQGAPGDPGGIGLGLYIVRRLADALGGSVSVSSQLGEGACFTLRLPIDSGRA